MWWYVNHSYSGVWTPYNTPSECTSETLGCWFWDASTYNYSGNTFNYNVPFKWNWTSSPSSAIRFKQIQRNADSSLFSSVSLSVKNKIGTEAQTWAFVLLSESSSNCDDNGDKDEHHRRIKFYNITGSLILNTNMCQKMKDNKPALYEFRTYANGSVFLYINGNFNENLDTVSYYPAFIEFYTYTFSWYAYSTQQDTIFIDDISANLPTVAVDKQKYIGRDNSVINVTYTILEKYDNPASTYRLRIYKSDNLAEIYNETTSNVYGIISVNMFGKSPGTYIVESLRDSTVLNWDSFDWNGDDAHSEV